MFKYQRSEQSLFEQLRAAFQAQFGDRALTRDYAVGRFVADFRAAADAVLAEYYRRKYAKRKARIHGVLDERTGNFNARYNMVENLLEKDLVYFLPDYNEIRDDMILLKFILSENEKHLQEREALQKKESQHTVTRQPSVKSNLFDQRFLI